MVRTGLGYDVHKLVEGRDLILCGEKIEYDRGLLGHSDADVALHALADALLGAVALRDIGYHFPDTDPRYKGADSRMLLREVARLVSEKATINNIDVTIIAQRPKLLNHIPAMIANIAADLSIPAGRVSVKATTTEHLGFEGRGEGISAMAIATVTELQ
ncbi:MAG: 2-C-methyl-D-erythritol 2,4-cyclodiphosphate synthase [Duncaniella sp.]|nr:2-C-methyl-D-erythritol 2,4-cyclodiphosphate synthase [Duncaniella sp.]